MAIDARSAQDRDRLSGYPDAVFVIIWLNYPYLPRLTRKSTGRVVAARPSSAAQP